MILLFAQQLHLELNWQDQQDNLTIIVSDIFSGGDSLGRFLDNGIIQFRFPKKQLH